MIQMDIEINQNLLISDMRSYILDEIKKIGSPLRWAITAVTHNSHNNSSQLRIEAIIII